MNATISVYISDYYFDVRFLSLLDCLQIVFLQNDLAFPTKVTWMYPKVNWFVDYKFIDWYK